jgi:AraC family transcriptional regulator, exoenzyme S synthesis regulatory protein ExsA
MSAIRFILSMSNTQITLRGERYLLPAKCLAITNSDVKIVGDTAHNTTLRVDFHTANLQQLYLDMVDLIEPPKQQVYVHDPVKIILVEKAVLDVFSTLIQLSPDSFLQFTYIYCLSLDRSYFSMLLHSYISGNKDFCHFIEESFMRQISVSELAQEFGLPLRKFNQLFLDTYGKSAKRWLLERRMKYAKTLLTTTTMRVIDIALECGFSNHAHFTDSFRRYFHCSPSQFRQHGGNPRNCAA